MALVAYTLGVSNTVSVKSDRPTRISDEADAFLCGLRTIGLCTIAHATTADCSVTPLTTRVVHFSSKRRDKIETIEYRKQ